MMGFFSVVLTAVHRLRKPMGWPYGELESSPFFGDPQGMELNGSVKRSRFFLAGLGALSGAAKTATTGYFMGMLAAFPVGECHEEKNRF
jgi:hypothetical protein